MADVTTRLEVQGAEKWVNALNNAATAQETLFAALSRKAPQVSIGDGLLQAVLTLDNAKIATERFKKENESLGASFEQVVGKVQGNTKALIEYGEAAQRAAKAQAEVNAVIAESETRLKARGSLLNSDNARFGSALDRQAHANAIDAATFKSTVPGGHGNLTTTRDGRVQNTVALAAQQQFVQQQLEQQAITDQKLVRGDQLREQRRNEVIAQGIEERGKRYEHDVQQSQQAAARLQQINEGIIRAERLLETQREKVEHDAARRRSTALHSQQSQDRVSVAKISSGTDFFSQRTGVKSPQTTGFNNTATAGLNNIGAATAKVTEESLKKNKALNEQDTAHKRSGSSGVTYLSTLSAIHAASFLLSNQTFTTVGSLTTLGFAVNKLGAGWGIIGVTFGVVLGFIGAMHTAFERLVQTVVTVGQAVAATAVIIATSAGAATAESIKLASTVESTFSEIAAFGEPGKLTGSATQDLTALDAVISGLSRNFGVSANDVTAGTSQFIRAGNDIEGAINGGAEAVVKLQIASRGELVPAQAARAVSTLSNSFKELKGDAAGAADIIIGTGQKSAFTMSEVSQAFQQAAPSAAQYNIKAIDLAATLAVLANNGLRGQVAGTGFKQVMLDLVNPTDKQAKALKDAGVSIKDYEGNIRPLGSIINDLNRAFGEEARALDKTGDASKAQGLAAIFGSRANLAASIIARTGSADFNKMRESIENTSSTDIVNTLLAPTAAQASIASANIQELARSFGGPLNVAIGSAISTVNKFLQGIDRSHFETAGQAILALATGQGFGPIVASLDELSKDHPEIANFLTELINNILAVRNVVISDFLPALSQAGSLLAEAFNSVGAEKGLNGITVAIIGLVQGASRLVVWLAELAREFVVGDGRGKELRDTVTGLATGIGTTLVGALIAAAVPMLAVIGLLQIIGKSAIETIQNIQRVHNIANAPASVKDAIREYGSLDAAIVKVAADSTRADARLKAAANAINEAERPTGAQLDERHKAALEVTDIGPKLRALQAYKQELEKVTQAPFQFNMKDMLEGDLPTFMTNLARDLKAAMESGRTGFDAPDVPGAFSVDPEKQAKILRQIRDIERDAARDTANLEEDLVVKRIEREESVSQRLLEIATSFVTRRQQILDEAKERKAEITENTQQQRQDRAVLESGQNFIRLLDREHEAANSRRDLREQQALSADERRQRDRVQISEKALSLQEQGEERFFSIQQQLLEKSFSRAQGAQDRALSLRQTNEEEQLNRQLRNEATLRDEQKRLAKAKTPQERAEIQTQITEAHADTAFSDRQQNQQTALRKKHEAERIKFQQQQEDNAFNYRLQLQFNEFNFKLNLEKIFQLRKRELEEQEFSRTDARDQALLEQRIGRSAFEGDRREQINKGVQNLQDQLQNEQNKRQQLKIDQNARRDIGKAGQSAVQQTFEALAASELAQQRAENQQQKAVRQIQQRAQERGTTLAEELGERPTALEAALGRVNLGLIRTGLLIQADTALASEFFNALRTEQFGNIQQFAPNVNLERPREGFAGILAPPVTSVHAPLNLTMPANFIRDLAAGVVAGNRESGGFQRQAPTQTINGNVYGFDDWQRLVNQFFFLSAQQRR